MYYVYEIWAIWGLRQLRGKWKDKIKAIKANETDIGK